MATYHESTYRVYYEDTDAGGIVYYANYLKFAERARTEWLRDHGFEQQQLRDKQRIGFVVKELQITYHQPAILDDMITVQSRLQGCKGATMTMTQHIVRDAVLLIELDVTLVCVSEDAKNQTLKPSRLPDAMRTALMQTA